MFEDDKDYNLLFKGRRNSMSESNLQSRNGKIEENLFFCSWPWSKFDQILKMFNGGRREGWLATEVCLLNALQSPNLNISLQSLLESQNKAISFNLFRKKKIQILWLYEVTIINTFQKYQYTLFSVQKFPVR